jgi:hypothetical protein
MSNPKSPAWYGGGISTIVDEQPGVGKIIYVDGTNGVNTNDGLTPAEPVLTITYALSLVTANANDYIIVLGYPGAAAGEVWPIAVNKAKVHIIGTPAQATPSPLLNAPADTACLLVSVNNVEIAGLEFSCGATHGCIETSGGVWKCHVHDNYFAWQDAGAYGIYLSNNTDNADCPQLWIHDNKFGEKLTDHNIWIAYNSTRSIIERNLFRGVATGKVGIYIDQAGADVGAILNNVFKVADAATGEAITCIAGTIGTLIAGNITGEGQVAMGNVPYRDLGGCHWGINYYDVRAIMPVTV